MLNWTYGSQKAHRFLAHPHDWLHFGIAVAEAGDPCAPRPSVHPDAAALHATVLALGEEDAALLVLSACSGAPPRRCRAQPQPYPMEVDRADHRPDQRWCWSTVAGRRVDYLVRVSERVTLPDRRHGQRVVAVDYCPIVWDPDPVWVETVDALHQRWLDAMQRLLRSAAALSLRHFRVVSLGSFD